MYIYAYTCTYTYAYVTYDPPGIINQIFMDSATGVVIEELRLGGAKVAEDQMRERAQGMKAAAPIRRSPTSGVPGQPTLPSSPFEGQAFPPNFLYGTGIELARACGHLHLPLFLEWSDAESTHQWST